MESEYFQSAKYVGKKVKFEACVLKCAGFDNVSEKASFAQSLDVPSLANKKTT